MATVLEFKLRPSLIPVSEFDTYELATRAQDHIEQYMRAPWLQQNRETQLKHLDQALELLERIKVLETDRPDAAITDSVSSGVEPPDVAGGIQS